MKNKAYKRFVFIDTETGGIIPKKHSLLSIGLAVWDKDIGILDQTEFYIYSKRYFITQKAKEINKFNRAEHNLIAKEPKVVINDMLNFLYKYFDKDYAIPLIGHNVQFDINFLKVLFENNSRSFNQYFSHRVIDTYSVYKTLEISNRINGIINSSSDAFKYFGIKVNNRHNALADCIATVELYEKLIKLIQNDNI